MALNIDITYSTILPRIKAQEKENTVDSSDYR